MHRFAVFSLAWHLCDNFARFFRVSFCEIRKISFINFFSIFLLFASEWASRQRPLRGFTRWTQPHFSTGSTFGRIIGEKNSPEIIYFFVMKILNNWFYVLFPFQPRERGKLRFHMLQNVQIALNFLKYKKVKIIHRIFVLSHLLLLLPLKEDSWVAFKRQVCSCVSLCDSTGFFQWQ